MKTVREFDMAYYRSLDRMKQSMYLEDFIGRNFAVSETKRNVTHVISINDSKSELTKLSKSLEKIGFNTSFGKEDGMICLKIN